VLESKTNGLQILTTSASQWREKGVSLMQGGTYKGQEIIFINAPEPSLSTAIHKGAIQLTLNDGRQFISHICSEPDPHLPHLTIHMKEIYHD